VDKSYLQRLVVNNVARMSEAFSRFIVSTVKFCRAYLCVVKRCPQVAVYSTTEHLSPLGQAARLPRVTLPGMRAPDPHCYSWCQYVTRNNFDPHCSESPERRKRLRASKLAATDLFVKKSQTDIFPL